jgi:cell division protein FtsI (penicillin-binding protein 3)
MASRAAPARRRPARRAPSPARLGARRVRAVAAICLLALILIGARAAWVALVDGPRLGGLVVDQLVHRETLPATRGAILDSDGGQLAISEPAVTVAVYPGEVSNPGAYAAVLAPILHVPLARLTALLGDKTHQYVYLAQNRVPSVEGRIETAMRASRLNGKVFDFAPATRRVYPEGIGRQVLGFTNPSGAGIAGAEDSLNTLLQGHDGTRVVQRGEDGSIIGYKTDDSAIAGKTVQLTIQPQIQAVTEQAVASTRVTQKAKAVTAIAIDIRTGGVLGMASSPDVPSAGYGHATPEEQELRGVVGGYEPGSVFKVVTMGAALTRHAITPQSQFTVPYSMSRFGQTIQDADYHPTQVMTAEQILEESSNVGTVTIARTRLGGMALSQEIARLGFGQKTGVELPGEIPGQILPYAKWSGTSILSFPIGIGVLVTPMQIVRLYAAIANGGLAHAPHIVDRIDSRPAGSAHPVRLFTPTVAHELNVMLQNVVTGSTGTGTQAKVPGYTVAGKTGTAPKLNKKGQYDGATAGYNSSFVGFLPASKPRVAILVLVDTPRAGSYYGGDVAAPAFSQIAARAMQVLQVPQDAPSS